MMLSHLILLQDLDYQLKLNGNMHIVREQQQHIMDLLVSLHNLMDLMILLINLTLFPLMLMKVKIQLLKLVAVVPMHSVYMIWEATLVNGAQISMEINITDLRHPLTPQDRRLVQNV